MGAHRTVFGFNTLMLLLLTRHHFTDGTLGLAGFGSVAGATALDTLDALKIGADDTVVISAAAGGVGSIEAQLAKHRGSTVVGTCGG